LLMPFYFRKECPLNSGYLKFPTTGSTSPAVPFQITFSECSKGTTGVRVAFNGIEDAENNTLLKLDEGSNTASGLGKKYWTEICVR
ncbi:type 1 fimbrial protein, partial [Shigella flexneri]